MKTLDGKKAIQFGWEATRANFWFFSAIVVMYLMAQYIPALLLPRMEFVPSGMAWETSVGAVVISALLTLFIQLGLIKMSLRVIDKKPLTYEDFFSVANHYWVYLLATILFMLLVGIGSVLLIVPGIIAGIMFAFYGYIMFEKNLQPIDALKKSMESTAGYKWNLFGFLAILALINFAGSMVYGIGLFITIPLSAVAMAHMYRQLV